MRDKCFHIRGYLLATLLTVAGNFFTFQMFFEPSVTDLLHRSASMFANTTSKSNNARIATHYPGWKQRYDFRAILTEICEVNRGRCCVELVT
jgi:hypothetical protein